MFLKLFFSNRAQRLSKPQCYHTHGDPVIEKTLREYEHQCIQPSIKYYHEHLASRMKTSLAVFKAILLFCPIKLQEIEVS